MHSLFETVNNSFFLFWFIIFLIIFVHIKSLYIHIRKKNVRNYLNTAKKLPLSH